MAAKRVKKPVGRSKGKPIEPFSDRAVFTDKPTVEEGSKVIAEDIAPNGCHICGQPLAKGQTYVCQKHIRSS